MNRERWIAVGIAAVLILVGLGYLANNYWTPAKVAKSMVALEKRVAKDVTNLAGYVANLERRITKIEKKKGAGGVSKKMVALEKRVAEIEKKMVPAPPTPPAVTLVAPSKDDGWRKVTTKDGWIRLGPPSTVPAPKVPVKGIEGPDIR